MYLLGVDPGYRHMGVVLVETNGDGKPRIVKRTTLKNGSIKQWQEGIPSLLVQLSEFGGKAGFSWVNFQDNGSPIIEKVGIEMISWYGKRRGSLQLAHLAGAIYGFYAALPQFKHIHFFTPKVVKATSEQYGAPKGFDEHQTDALSICRLLAAQ